MKSVFKILKFQEVNDKVSFVYINEKRTYDEAKEWLSKAFICTKLLNEKERAFDKAAKTANFKKELEELENLQDEMRSNGYQYFDDYESYVIQEAFKSD